MAAEDKILQYFKEIFKENHEKIDHAAELKSQEVLAEVNRSTEDKMDRIKEELQEFTQQLKEELANTANEAGNQMLQAILEAVKEKQKQRGWLWFLIK
jgi:glutamyl-tRNA reductase